MAIEITQEQFDAPVIYTVQLKHGRDDTFEVNLLDITAHPRSMRAVMESMRRAADLIQEHLDEAVTSQGNGPSQNVTQCELSENFNGTEPDHVTTPGSVD